MNTVYRHSKYIQQTYSEMFVLIKNFHLICLHPARYEQLIVYLEACDSDKLLSVMFLKYIALQRNRFKIEPKKKPIFVTVISELSIAAKQVFLRDSYCQFPSET